MPCDIAACFTSSEANIDATAQTLAPIAEVSEVAPATPTQVAAITRSADIPFAATLGAEVVPQVSNRSAEPPATPAQPIPALVRETAPDPEPEADPVAAPINTAAEEATVLATSTSVPQTVTMPALVEVPAHIIVCLPMKDTIVSFTVIGMASDYANNLLARKICAACHRI